MSGSDPLRLFVERICECAVLLITGPGISSQSRHPIDFTHSAALMQILGWPKTFAGISGERFPWLRENLLQMAHSVPAITSLHTLGKNRLLHLGMRYLFGDYSYSIWLAESMFSLCIVCNILFNVYFGKFVITFIDIGGIGCMSIPKCHWMVIVINLIKQTWCCLLVWFCVCRVSIEYSHL